MAQFIFLRLVPQKPVSADVFKSYLTDFDPGSPSSYHVLVLEAYDRSFANPNGEPTRLGRAVHLPDILSVSALPIPPQPIPVPTTFWPRPPGTALVEGTMIAQHRTRVDDSLPLGNFHWDMKSVATAAIPITSPSPHEFEQPDVIIRVKWASVSGTTIDFDNAKLLETVSIDYNVAVGDRTGPFPPIDLGFIPAGEPGTPGSPDTFLTIDAFLAVAESEIAGYVGLVDPNPDVPSVPLPKDGNPPNFEALLQAVNAVMTMDPDTLSFDPASMTPQQARQVAYEIVWNRHTDPLPQPSDSGGALEDMYTAPGNEENRARFEGALAAYLAQHDAQAETLANYVFALSAALGAQTKSDPASQVTFTFPIRPDLDAPTGGRVKDAQVTLNLAVTAGHSLDPALRFVVPAEYFYALSANLPIQVDADTRFGMVTHASEKESRDRMQDAIDRGIIASTLGRFRLSTADSGTDLLVTPAQAARRLRAFVDVPGLPTGEVLADDTGVGDDLHQLIGDWLAYNNPSGPAPDPVDDINFFWHGIFVGVTASPQDQRGHLRLVVVALTKHSILDQDPKDLIDTMAASGISPNPFPHDKVVGDFAAIEFDWWREFFHRGVTDSNPGDNFAFLPEFTKPGTLDQRIETFIRRLQQFFDLSDVGSGFVVPSGDEPSSFGPVGDIDPLKAFFTTFPGFDLNDPIVEATLRDQVGQIFGPEDSRGRQWLFDAIVALHDLLAVTDVTTPATPSTQLRFSLMEALYSRGFTSVASIIGLSAPDFTDALTGTVAHEFAAAIFAKAGGGSGPGGGETGTPTAINQDGMLVNCIPPDHLSPLGPTAYLHELLQLSRESTCMVPFPEGGASLAGLIVHRRGAPGDMLVTRANLETPLPFIDLVNECLEGLAVSTPPGVVFDTASSHLPEPDGHLLRNPDATDVDQTLAHDPATIFAAMPEHSSPATPVGQPAAYDAFHLRTDLSATILPYSQPLDICRSTLGQMRTSRFAVMRAFRQAITEFVLSPSSEPVGFQSQQWRFPVRLDIALEYLGISPEEASEVFSEDLSSTDLRLMLGLQEGEAFDSVLDISTFLQRTGLSYCELVALVATHREGLDVASRGEGESPVLPTCEPCCPDNDLFLVVTGDTEGALRRLIVFIRLWSKLQELPGARYTFAQLSDIADVLTLFFSTGPNAGNINPDFIRQLAAFQMLRDELHLPLADETVELAPSDTGARRTHLLALWVEAPSDPSDPLRQRQDWAIEQVLQHIRDHAQPRFGCADRPPEFLKLLRSNLDPLSSLCGFNPSDTTRPPITTWHDHPTHTLRFAEVLAKIFASKFGVGEIEFLFTADEHLDGDDPFPLSSENEALDSPLHLPDDDAKHSLWALRRKLLDARVPEEQIGFWSWPRIDASLREEFGFRPPLAGDDPLVSFAEHFFPNIVACGHCVDPLRRRYTVLLAAPATSEPMWNTPPDGPFHLLESETGAQELWTELPLMDEAVLEKLSRLRPLGPNERKAVQDLYFAPRVQLAQLAFLFPNLLEAEQHLIQEPDETKRWLYFQRAFALAHARSRIIAEHLTEHVGAIAGPCSVEGANLAFVLLRSLLADENKAKSPWEDDGGARPEVTWAPLPSGGAFAALLGLLGTGLRGELRSHGSDSLVWREIRGPMDAFGAVRNAWNAPAPTILPEMDLTLSHEQLRFVGIRNGFALENDNAERLNGAEGFLATWTGVLLIEASGGYVFQGGMPTPDGVPPAMDGTQNQRWRVTLSEGQRSWVVLSHEWTGKDWQPTRAKPISLRHGAYDLTVELIQCPPIFDAKDAKPAKTGFQLKYSGPDTEGRLSTIPGHRLFIAFKDAGIDDGLDEDVMDTLPDDEHPSLLPEGPAKAYLHSHYVSTLRDIRRTYQRAFKALLFAHRLRLSAKPISDDGKSEIEFLLDHGASFSGLSFHPQGPSYVQHLANLDFNFLPVGDNYHPPLDPLDQRAAPSLKRQQAMFDWWERLFDYTVLRDCVRADSPEPPAWLLFHEAVENHPDDPAQLLRYLGIDLSHTDPEDGAPLVLRFFNQPAGRQVGTSDLTDERWPIRVWHADRWIRRLLASFDCKDIRDARPDLWASDDPGVPFPTPVDPSGNQNLTRFVQDGYFENGEPRRYEDLKRLNDGLRERARAALVAYLTARGASRVLLPWGGAARSAKDLSEFLLIDVEAGICQRASRIEEAITAVQAFVQRARLGLEEWVPSVDFVLLWDRRFADLRTWQACKRKAIYKENWIEWPELQTARRSESFRYLEDQLRRAALTIATSAGTTNFDGPRAPVHPGIGLLQSREPSVLQSLPTPSPAPADGGTTREGFTLLGTPDRHGRPSWLASPPLVRPITSSDKLPYWIEAAIRLGARFVRVAAAGLPMGAATFDGPAVGAPSICCKECGAVHPPCVDEYYFWLMDSHHFKSQDQNADTTFEGSNPEVQTAWHSERALPSLLFWKEEPMVHLFWTRVHNGELKQMRRSREGVPISTEQGAETPDLVFLGRFGDSLRFAVTGGETPTPTGYPTDPKPGFRYDLPTDTAEVLPLVFPQPDPGPALVTVDGVDLAAYPYFVYFTPGAPLVPLSFFSQATSVAGVLRSHCRFEAALKWYEGFFNPLQDNASWCQLGEGVTCCEGGAIDPSASDACAIARNRAITLNYLETLLDWGDALVRRHSPEAFQRARLVFDAASRILGVRPRTVLAKAKLDEPVSTVATFDPQPAPVNPRLLSLYERIGDRLSLLHHCINGRRYKNGVPNKDMPYFGDLTVVNGWESTTQPCLDEGDWCVPSCAYRFTSLIPKAIELAGAVRAFGSELLAAFEKGDAEYLAALRAGHERQLAELALAVRKNQWREADWQVQASEFVKEIAQTRRRYFQGLIDVGLISGEVSYQALTIASTVVRAGGNIIEAIGQVLQVTPDIYTGTGFFLHVPSGSKLGGVFHTIATIANTVADILVSTAGLNLTQAGWDRREAEWRHQVEVLDLEIQQDERQILAAERRRDVALHELNNQRRQMEQLAEVQDFLRDKFTSHELYLWLQRETAALYRQMYELALHAARQAQKAFNYERGHETRDFLKGELWSDLHEGLLAGERLETALRQMDKAYIDENTREYELTKHVSLRQLFPQQLLQLKLTGRCEIELPEWLFDLDYPGHYMRRIKNISLSVPSVLGPFTGVHCRLTLLSSSTRIDPRLNGPVAMCCGRPVIDRTSHRCKSCGHVHPVATPIVEPQAIENGYPSLPDDPRIVRQYAAMEAIATSSAQNDSGLFELNFRDERYLPFEFAGAVGRYRIELPPENNYFDFATITDLVMHLKYTAREGGEVLRAAAAESARRRLPDGGERLLDIKMELPDVWHRFVGQPANEPKTLELSLERDLFQFLPGQPDLRIKRVEVLFAAPCAVHDGVRKPAQQEIELARVRAGHDAADAGCAQTVDCVESAEFPGLFHGVAAVDIEPVTVQGPAPVITFRFPGETGPVERLFVACLYEAGPADKKLLPCHRELKTSPCDRDNPPRP